MAQGKKSFLLYCDTIHTVKKLTDEQAGNLFKHILMYVNDENPTADNIITELTFEPIKQALKRDLARYEGIVEKRSLAGQASAEKRKQNQHMSTHVESVQQSSTNPTDNDIVIDSVIVIDNEIVKEKNIAFSFRKALTEFGVDRTVLDDWLKVRKNKKLTNSETAFKAIQREIYKSNLPPTECIKIAVEKSWGGFEAEWINNIKTNKNENNKRDLSQIDHGTARKLADM